MMQVERNLPAKKSNYYSVYITKTFSNNSFTLSNIARLSTIHIFQKLLPFSAANQPYFCCAPRKDDITQAVITKLRDIIKASDIVLMSCGLVCSEKVASPK